MSMFLLRGDYQHASGEIDLQINKAAIFSAAGRPIGYTETWTINGKLHGSSVSDLTARLALLEAEYSTNYKNVGLYNDDGSATQHVMRNDAAQGGIRVVSLRYPQNPGDYVTYRNYEIVLEGRFISAGKTELISWTEILSFIGDGGPRFVMMQPLIGAPIKYQVASRTPFICQQSGSAVLLGQYPIEVAPLFPDDEHRDRRRIEKKKPDLINGVYQNYGISWNYEFESASPLFGEPSTQGA